MVRILHLTLKKQWFDMIASGEKTEEYRELKMYWHKRLSGKTFDAIQFRNGYGKGAPKMLVELKAIIQGHGRPEWGSGYTERYILRLGRMLQAP
ncbi:MAG: ASCH domain-containing protein [Gammaproteobacteria bacterium]|nr:ASCH domain-containing protein [Gammaproteobacteria bacterium]